MRFRAAWISSRLIAPAITGHLDLYDLCVERLTNFGGQLLLVERFREEEHFLVAAIAGLQRFLEVTGNENDFRAGTRFVHPIGETTAAHLRHDDVGEQEIDLVPVAA